MQTNVSIEDSQIKQTLSELSARKGNLSPIMKVIGEIVRASVERNFAAGGRPKWKESGRAKREGGQTLSLSGRLRRSFTVQAGNNRVAVGTNVIYAAIQQLGGKTPAHVITAKRTGGLFWPGAKHPVKSVKHPGSNIPVRPFLMVQDEDWIEIKSVLNNYLMGRR